MNFTRLFQKAPKLKTKLNQEHRLGHLLEHPAESLDLARNPLLDHHRNLDPVLAHDPNQVPLLDLAVNQGHGLGLHSHGTLLNQGPNQNRFRDLDPEPLRVRGPDRSRDPVRDRDQAVAAGAVLVVAVVKAVLRVNKEFSNEKLNAVLGN